MGKVNNFSIIQKPPTNKQKNTPTTYGCGIHAYSDGMNRSPRDIPFAEEYDDIFLKDMQSQNNVLSYKSFKAHNLRTKIK